MLPLWEIQNIKDIYGSQYSRLYESFVEDKDAYDSLENDLSEKELDVAISEGTDSIYGKPDIKVNIPLGRSLEINFEPVLDDKKGEFTEEAEAVDTVKSDPFDISPISDPEDPFNYLNSEEEKEEKDDTPRYMTLQDLM